MRKMDSDGLMMCDIQGIIFEKSLEKVNFGSPLFVKKYMMSNDAASMDKNIFLDLCRYDDQILEDINNTNPRNGTKYTSDVLYWMGYIYRYWAYIYEISSKKLYSLFPGNRLAGLYYTYHTFDPQYAIERIIESNSLNVKQNINDKCEFLIKEKIKELKVIK